MKSLAELQAQRSPTTSAWTEWWRWLAVLPAAILVSGITNAALGKLTFALASLLSVPTLASIVSILIVPFFSAAVFVMAGSVVAPHSMVKTARVLIVFFLLLSLCLAVVLWSGVEIPWLKVDRSTADAPWMVATGTALAIAGLCFGLHFVKRDAAKSQAR